MLELAPEHPIVNYWLAYLLRDQDAGASSSHLRNALSGDPRLVFPHRRETLSVLAWAYRQEEHWKTDYYRGLLYWEKDQEERAWTHFQTPGNQPDFAPFYLTRGLFGEEIGKGNPKEDFDRALDLAPSEWRTYHHRIHYALDHGDPERVVRLARQAYEQFPENYVIGMDLVRVLNEVGTYQDSLAVLKDLHILPYEGADEGHQLWVEAHLLRGLKQLEEGENEKALDHFRQARKWPERLGVGKPYHPDERMIKFVIAHALKQAGRPDQAKERLREIIKYTEKHRDQPVYQDLFTILAHRQLNQKDRVTSFLQILREQLDEDTTWFKWLRAFANEDDKRAGTLAGELVSDGSARDANLEGASKTDVETVVKVFRTINKNGR